MLDPYKLQIFECVIHEGSFSAAAEQLMMSQSAVSQHIRDLENTLGVQLFRRSRRGAKPTTSGRVLHDYAMRILHLVSAAENAVKEVSNTQSLTARADSTQVRVEATPGISIYVLSGWVQTYRERYPDMPVSLETRITPEIVQDVMTHIADFGIIEGELNAPTPSGLRMRELELIPQYVVVGRQHEFWERTRLDIEELNGRNFIMRQPAAQTRIWLDATLALHKVKPTVNTEFDNVESIKRMVASSNGLTILPLYAIRDEEAFGTLRAMPITGEPLQRTLKLVWNGRRDRTAAARSVLQHLAQRYPAINVMLSDAR